MHRCMTTWHGFTANYHDPVYNFFLLCHMTQKSISWVEKLWKFDYFFNFKKLYCHYLPFRSLFMASYYSSSLSWVDMHWSHESEDIYNFQLAIWVNTNNIGDFFTTKLCPLRDPVRALIGFSRCQIASLMVQVVLHQYSLVPFCCINYELNLGNTHVWGQWIVYTMSQRHGRYWRGSISKDFYFHKSMEMWPCVVLPNI